MDDETSAWEGVEIAPDKPRIPNQPVGRRRPEEERTLNAAKILAGLAGEKEQHAVRFKDLERMEQELLSRLSPSQRFVADAIGKQIRSQFAAINTESKALVSDFNELFDIAKEDLEALGTEVDAEFDIFETALNGNSASIAILSASIDGVKAVWGIRTNVNGHVSGISLISSAVDGGAQTDFLIIDSSLRVVNTSGVGGYTPFAVYPTGRYVDGAFVPAGVHAEDLYVTRANIADLAVDNAKIANAAITTAKIGDAEITNAKIGTAEVGTLTIDGNAVTIPTSGTSSIIFGNNAWQSMVNIAISLPVQSDVLLFWSIEQGYSGTIPTWGYQLRSASLGTIYDEREGMTFGNDQPSGQWLLLDQSAGSFSAQLRWKGQNGDISGKGTLTVLVVQR